MATFVDRLAREVQRRWPDENFTIVYLPYLNYTTAPAGFRFPGNVEVQLAGMPGLASYKEPAIRDAEQANIDRWIATSQADWSLDFDIGMSFMEWHAPVPLAHEKGIFDRALKFLLKQCDYEFLFQHESFYFLYQLVDNYLLKQLNKIHLVLYYQLINNLDISK